MDYKKAGVDIEAGYKSVELMKEHVNCKINRCRLVHVCLLCKG